jgi:hypothetical protein
MIDIFEDIVDLTNITCHSGGATGADSVWEVIGQKFGVKTKAYSYKTSYHKSPNKVEISEEDYQEGVVEVNKANKHMDRFGIHKYMNLLARNWAQVKYSTQVFAIGTIVEPGQKSSRGFYSKSKIQTVDGGTGYAVMMAINNKKDVYVYEQIKQKWFRWSYSAMKFIQLEETPTIKTQNFAGIGTREINSFGSQSIEDVYQKTFKL